MNDLLRRMRMPFIAFARHLCRHFHIIFPPKLLKRSLSFFRLPSLSLSEPVDMDIPLPDELEWLEANSHLDEDHQDPPLPDPCPFPPEEEPRSPTSSSDSPFDGRKRTRSNDPDSPFEDVAVHSLEKRIKTYGAGQESGEDWLRFSPPREQRAGAGEEESVEVVVEEKKEEERILSRYVSEIDGDFIPVTAPSGGDRVYAKICRVEKEERPKKLNVNGQSNGLILETVNVLLQRVEQEAFAKALHASTADQTDVIPYETQVVHEKLWVDKYAPNSFTELLSDEQTNREVLLWLKQWDSSVFGSEIRSTSDDVLSALRHHSSVAQHQRHSDSMFLRKNRGQRWNNGNLRHYIHLDHERNNLKGFRDLRNTKPRLSGPPEHKILLLCGPPGLGKTTLAHVAAKHCGYRVVEVNASDDRSSATIESKILDVVQMNSVIADSKPKCLVIDEIDGALGDGKGAVEVILKMVSAERNSGVGKENVSKGEQSGRMSSKKGHKTTPLLRPVICICNDLYVPALRPLRQVAKVHIFVQPTVSRVVSRLKHICNNEGMNTSSIALAVLAEYTECDIRSCLNTLQFLNKKKETLNVLDIGSQVVGRKDMSRSVFDIWKEIFQKRKVKRERKSGSSCGSMSNGTHFLHALISNRGDYDLIFNGVHENILQLHYHDPIMQKTVKCFNSLGVSDLLHQYTLRTQQMTLNAYQPPLAIIIHCLLAQVQKPNIEWPKSYQRYRTMLMDKMDMLRTWQSKIPPYISRHLSTKSVAEDSISFLLHILSPPTLRPVPLHLLSEKEKDELAQLVSSMVSYSVTYKNTKISPLSCNQQHEAALDASMLSFDPPISDLINFKGYNSGHYVFPIAMKQVLVHEVERQKILQVSRSVHDECTKQNLEAEGQKSGAQSAKTYCAANYVSIQRGMKMSSPSKCEPSGSTKSSKLDSGKSAMSSAIGRCSENQKKASNASANFFDRFRKVSTKGSLDTGTNVEKKITLERDSHPLLFKFNEGFTNAVKRPIRMCEFLL